MAGRAKRVPLSTRAALLWLAILQEWAAYKICWQCQSQHAAGAIRLALLVFEIAYLQHKDAVFASNKLGLTFHAISVRVNDSAIFLPWLITSGNEFRAKDAAGLCQATPGEVSSG